MLLFMIVVLRFHVFIHKTNYENLPGKEYSELNWRGKTHQNLPLKIFNMISAVTCYLLVVSRYRRTVFM